MYADAQIGKERATARLGADDQNNRQQVLSRPADMTRPDNQAKVKITRFGNHIVC